jgi:TM2 domain-containing membrane protein YozV
MFCRNCGNQVSEQAVICPKCGVPPLAGSNMCWSCGKPTTPGAELCMNCGVRLANAANTSEKSRLAAGLFGIFLGEFGVHRFYLGFVGLGIVQIIVTLVTFGIGGLWGVIEGIVILAGGFNKDGKGRVMKPL